ncbi:hypothetical protein Leryth_011864 [Lithospermum erythrorhizon]|nr:hypothetical protein Leryth_011864 [Lithospermum erythrorhizon]
MVGESVNFHGGFIFLILLFFSIFVRSQAVWLTLPSKGTKCISEELHNNILVLGDYVVISDDSNHHPPQTISIKVTSPFGKTIYQMESVTHGQFAFTASESGNYLACFWSDGNHGIEDVSVNVDWKSGVAAKDWDSVARKENVEGLALELMKLGAVVEAVRENLIYLKTRESEMWSVSEITNSRVAWYSMMSVGICISASVLQIAYLKQYFHQKKVI